jgi:hypothetical protein
LFENSWEKSRSKTRNGQAGSRALAGGPFFDFLVALPPPRFTLGIPWGYKKDFYFMGFTLGFQGVVFITPWVFSRKN